VTTMSAPTRRTVTSTDLRSRFAVRLSNLYASEVPLYETLVDVSQDVNERVLRREGVRAERLGSIARVTAERHGAIRVGMPEELAEVARVFGALGMHPCGFYDLRDAHPQPVPVVSTAFRPLDRDELAENPFRVFTSMLVPEDRRFFDADLETRLKGFLAARRLFPDELLVLADRARDHGELSRDDAQRFLDLATASFALLDLTRWTARGTRSSNASRVWPRTSAVSPRPTSTTSRHGSWTSTTSTCRCRNAAWT
jgi:uncharacterized glyoxalase superfamily metalloenzyme YdcJ